jgi:Glycosyl hydrolases family 35
MDVSYIVYTKFYAANVAMKSVFPFPSAKQAGLSVVAGSSPYYYDNTNGGGLTLYLSDGSGGKLRTSDSNYFSAWLIWMEKIGAILANNQITNRGNLIVAQVENELQETTYSANDTLLLCMK